MKIYLIKPSFFLFIFLLYTSYSSAFSASIPLNQKGRWQTIEYDSIPANKVSFSSQGMLVRVNKSASPLVYPLTGRPLFIKKISIKGFVNKLVSIANPQKQGEKGFDDFNLRLGLVLLGSNRLGFFKRKLTPDWVLRLFRLAPKDQGIDHISFLNATISPKKLHETRTHPLSKYIKESNVWLMNKSGNFSYSHNFPKAQHTGALWISIDGDDTKSSFDITIKSIEIESL